MGKSFKMSEEESQAYIAELVARAHKAQKVAEKLTQRQVDELAAAIVYKLSRPEIAREIAELALEESHMGRVDSKMGKLTAKMPGVLYDVLKERTVGIVNEEPDMGIIKIAKPVGVIAALIPSTNPEGTVAFKGVLGLRGRNAVIFSPHPATYRTSDRVCEYMREILKKNDLPEDIFICVDKPSIRASQILMSQCDLTVATGSHDMVRMAYSSGKPAYGVGAGNAVVIIDETADLADAAQKISISKLNDWASGCSAENSLLLHESIYDQMIAELVKNGGYMATGEEKLKLEKVMWPDGGKINREIVAKPAQTIAGLAGIDLAEGAQFIMVEETGYGADYRFSHEKLSVVMTIYRYRDFGDAVEMVNGIQKYSGLGHSCGIHSFNENHIRILALGTYTAKVIVRQAHSLSNSGAWHNGLAKTFTLGCGTWGGNIVSENVTQKHFINTTWLTYAIDRQPLPDEQIYGDLLEHVKY